MGYVSPEERACMTLAYSGGMSHPEIGRITGLPVGTVKSHIQRGKQKLQRWLQDHDHTFSKNHPGPGGGPPKEAQSA
jgi:DNA-directed RNA polymerase specialized sigma24 family protein